MYFVYVLKSKEYNWFYVGLTGDIKRRLKEHNSGKMKSTKFRRPYDLIFYSRVKDLIEARKLEKYYKSGIGRERIKKYYNNNARVAQWIEQLPSKQ